MEPLATIKWAMTWICMYPTMELSSLFKKISHKVCGLVFFAISVVGVAVCIAFIWKFVATNLIESLFAFLGVALYSESVYTMPIAYFSRQKAQRIFKTLSEIYNTCEWMNAIGWKNSDFYTKIICDLQIRMRMEWNFCFV